MPSPEIEHATIFDFFGKQAVRNVRKWNVTVVERIFQFLWQFLTIIFIVNSYLTILKHKLREFSMLKRFCEDFIKFLRNRVEWKLV